MKPIGISAFTVTTALGAGSNAQLDALQAERSGLTSQPFEDCRLSTWTGPVKGLEAPLPDAWRDWDCRNNRLAERALQQDDFLAEVARLRERYGAGRVGVFVGSSTSGVHHLEQAYRALDKTLNRLPEWFQYRTTQNMFSAADFVRNRLALDGVCATLSTACSSSAKVFASAYRGIVTGQCDVAVVGGVDSLCQTTLSGFNSLQLLSKDACKPADCNRDGISIGEAAGFAILEPNTSQNRSFGLALLGYGESSDAWHMSAPEPNGRGAFDAMQTALIRAGVLPAEVDYINLHGTATPANDLAESRAVGRLFGAGTPCSSTKGWTGHTLGAAGIVEAVLSLLCLKHGLIPRSLNTESLDPELGVGIAMHSRNALLRYVLSNSFGFGGSNCSLLFGRTA